MGRALLAAGSIVARGGWIVCTDVTSKADERRVIISRASSCALTDDDPILSGVPRVGDGPRKGNQ